MCNCGKKAIRSVALRRTLGLSAPGSGEEVVLWQTQPNQVTIYTGTSGRAYTVRNRGEKITINRADRPYFESMGFIDPVKE